MTVPMGVVVRRRPGVSRWAKWHWQAVAVLPGAAPADWAELRSEENVTDFHAATVDMELHRAETEAYRVAISNEPASVWVILRPCEDPNSSREYTVHAVTASPFEAQDYLDSGEEIVEAVPMPPGIVALIRDFVNHHHRDEPFKKRRRDRVEVDRSEDGIGDARIRQASDVYRAPRTAGAHPAGAHGAGQDASDEGGPARPDEPVASQERGRTIH